MPRSENRYADNAERFGCVSTPPTSKRDKSSERARPSIGKNDASPPKRAKNITGKAAEAVLGRAHMTVNKNAIPNDPEKPFVTSGIRIGAPAMTTRGFGTTEATTIANLMADVLEAPGDDAAIARVAGEITALCRRFPVYGPGSRD